MQTAFFQHLQQTFSKQFSMIQTTILQVDHATLHSFSREQQECAGFLFSNSLGLLCSRRSSSGWPEEELRICQASLWLCKRRKHKVPRRDTLARSKVLEYDCDGVWLYDTNVTRSQKNSGACSTVSAAGAGGPFAGPLAGPLPGPFPGPFLSAGAVIWIVVTALSRCV